MELRPLSIADILDCTVEILWKKFWLLCALSVFIQCPAFFIIDVCLKGIGTYVSSHDTISSSFTGLIAMLPFLFALIAFYFIAKGAVASVASGWILGRSDGFMISLEKIIGRIITITSLALIMTLMSLLFLIVPFILIMSAYIEGKQLFGVFFFFILAFLVISFLGMWFMVRSCLSLSAVISEKMGALKALRRSWALSHNYWWKAWVVWMLIHSVILIAGGFVFVSLGTRGILFLMLILPLSTIGETVLLYDLKVRKEAYDLKFLAAKRKKEWAGAGARDNEKCKV